MPVTVAASSLKEALELLAADIAECCGCESCCVGERCWINDCPGGMVSTGYTAALTVDWATLLTDCNVCEALLPGTLNFTNSTVLGDPGYYLTYAACVMEGGDAYGIADDTSTYTLTDGDTYCLMDIQVFLVCIDGVPNLQVFIGVEQGCIPDGRPCPGSAEICNEAFELYVPLSSTCGPGDAVRIQGSSGPLTVDFTFTYECAP